MMPATDRNPMSPDRTSLGDRLVLAPADPAEPSPAAPPHAGLGERLSQLRPFAHRTAFVLNANARAVSTELVEGLAAIVPAGDLFLSRTPEDARAFARTILRRGYGRVFLGGGDGTLVMSLNLLKTVADEEHLPMPQVGVLKLGTGNAMATALAARRAQDDVRAIVAHEGVAPQPTAFLQTDDGQLTPFAGMGYDGAVVNDYVWLKKQLAPYPALRAASETVAGYLAAAIFRTVPQQLTQPFPRVRVTSSSDAYWMKHTPQGDVEVRIPAGEVLFEGEAPIMSIGTIPYYGFGFTMFPFAGRKPGYAQLRVGAPSLAKLLTRLYPAVWRGNFRDDKLRDILVKDVVIESDKDLPYQVGGDARGHRRRIALSVSGTEIQMVALERRAGLTSLNA